MKKLEIQLNQVFKSFPNGFRTTLEGDLVVLSGVNGSGKTQLFDVIRGFQDVNKREKIIRELKIDGVDITDDQIVHRSIRDYANVGSFTQGSARSTEDQKGQLWGWYTQYNLNPAPTQVGGFQDSCKRARELLIDRKGDGVFGQKIEKEEFDTIFADFVLYQDDIFTNKIGEIFFRYTSEREHKIYDAHKKRELFNDASLPSAPWTILNKLFEKLKLGYRFKHFYENKNHALSPQPVLYSVGKDGVVNESDTRKLEDLSDGEKAIISLTFATLASEETHPKVLILDEYDAPLNPSLVDAYFEVLKDFFIDKGVLVIVATHSTATLSLAPAYTNFYEMLTHKTMGSGRLLPIGRNEYDDMRLVNKEFVDRINNLESNIKKLEANILAATKPQIITEGDNIDHIKKALSILSPTLLESVDFVDGNRDRTGKDDLVKIFPYFSNRPSGENILFVFDCDAESEVKKLKETQNAFAFHFMKNRENTKEEKGIENLYPDSLFTGDMYNTTVVTTNNIIKHSESDLDKKKLFKKIEKETSAIIFSGFNPLIEKIKTIINPAPVQNETANEEPPQAV